MVVSALYWEKAKILFSDYKIPIFIIVGFAFFVISIYLTSKTISSFNDQTYYANDQPKGTDLHTSFLQANRDCRHAGDAADQNRCYESVATLVERHVHSRDLVAQETMALGTRGILLFTGWLALISFFALAFTAIGIYLVWQSLKENRKTFKHIQKSSIAELKPYLSLKFDSANYGVDEYGEYRIFVNLDICNFGQTPATHVTINANGGKGGIGVFFLPQKAKPDFNGVPTVFYRSVNTCIPIVEMHQKSEEIPITCPTANWLDQSGLSRSQVFTEESDRGASMMRFWKIIINNLEVRYKDIEWEGTSSHKIIKGGMLAYNRGDGFSVHNAGFKKDSEHSYYEDLAKRKIDSQI